MLPIDTYLDRILKHLSWNRKEFEATDTLFSKYDVPEEIQESVINTLKHHEFIESKKFIGNREYIKIADKGYHFITTTCFKDSDDLTRIANISSNQKMEGRKGVQRHLTMTAESAKYHVGEPIPPKGLPKSRQSKWGKFTTHPSWTFWSVVITLAAIIISIFLATRLDWFKKHF